MKPSQKLLLKFAGAWIAVASLLLALFFFESTFVDEELGIGFFKGFEKRSYDMLMRARGVRPHRNDLALIKIDDYTDKKLGWPIPHDQYGVVFALLSNFGAQSVALDALLPKTEQDSSENELMLQYMQQAEHIFQVVGPFVPSDKQRAQISTRDVDSSAHYVVSKFSIPSKRGVHFPRSPYFNDFPFKELADASSGIGHVLLTPDPYDGIIRSAPLFVEYASRLYPSLGFILALDRLHIPLRDVRVVPEEDGTLVEFGTHRVKTDKNGELLINYIGAPDKLFGNFGSPGRIPYVSFYDILEAGKNQDTAYLAQFRDKVCIIGPTVRSIGDYYALPVSESSPGFITHANVYDMIISDEYIRQAGGWLQLFLLVVVTGLSAFAAHTKSLRTGVMIFLGTLFLLVTVVFVSFSEISVWFGIAQPLFSMSLCFIGTTLFRASTEGKQRKMITGMFERYVNKEVVQHLIVNPDAFKLGGERREITILFSDIKGFSTISEQINEETLVKILNIYLTEMCNCIMKHGGTVDKFVGDAIMAFWGAPLPDPDAKFKACLAGLEMQRQLTKIQPTLRKIADVEIQQRIGVNTGSCIVGNMGSDQKFNYTAIGDPVNLASRLEGANKQYHTSILISEMTMNGIANKVLTREVDQVLVIGKTAPVRVYELIDVRESAAAKKLDDFLKYYHEALQLYKTRQWDEAQGIFEYCMQLKPGDSLCDLYIQRLSLYKTQPPPSDWDGTFTLKSK